MAVLLYMLIVMTAEGNFYCTEHDCTVSSVVVSQQEGSPEGRS